jgi:predicted amidohydrolase YtcJ
MTYLLRVSTFLCISIYSIAVTATPPDTILFNGKILTVDPQFSVAEAIAISDGRIVAVGTNTEVLELAASQTDQFDLEGHTVIPGLIDNHMHYMRGASRWRFEARIDGVTSRKKALNTISQKQKDLSLGNGCSYSVAGMSSSFLTHREDLQPKNLMQQHLQILCLFKNHTARPI